MDPFTLKLVCILISQLKTMIHGIVLHFDLTKYVAHPKYYINNPLKLIKNTASSGGVEALLLKGSHTVRLSISPSQGDDPGFKSRPEHFYFVRLNPGWGYF